jgi:gluconokinase
MENVTHLVIMGVSGSGKTTIATALSQKLGWSYAEADDFHSTGNIAKMAQGTPLTDDDRWPWLTAIQQWMTAKSANGESTIVTCSALKRSYRDMLASAGGNVTFIHLHNDAELIRMRMRKRSEHFMPESLLTSQMDTLQPLQPDENGISVPNTGTPAQVLDLILEHVATQVVVEAAEQSDTYHLGESNRSTTGR